MKTEIDQDILDKIPSTLRKDIDENLCTCMDVPMRDIVIAILNGATTVEEVKKQTYASKGAGCCVMQIERLIECLCAPPPRKMHKRKNK